MRAMDSTLDFEIGGDRQGPSTKFQNLVHTNIGTPDADTNSPDVLMTLLLIHFVLRPSYQRTSASKWPRLARALLFLWSCGEKLHPIYRIAISSLCASLLNNPPMQWSCVSSESFFSANLLNIKGFRAIADHEKFRHQVIEIIWDDARLPRGPRTLSGLPGWENEMVSDEESTDNETEIALFRENCELDWPREYSDDDDDEDDEDDDGEEDDGGGDPTNQLRRSTKFKTKDCPIWFKAACAASVEDAFLWRCTNRFGKPVSGQINGQMSPSAAIKIYLSQGVQNGLKRG